VLTVPQQRCARLPTDAPFPCWLKSTVPWRFSYGESRGNAGTQAPGPFLMARRASTRAPLYIQQATALRDDALGALGRKGSGQAIVGEGARDLVAAERVGGGHRHVAN